MKEEGRNDHGIGRCGKSDRRYPEWYAGGGDDVGRVEGLAGRVHESGSFYSWHHRQDRDYCPALGTDHDALGLALGAYLHAVQGALQRCKRA